MNLAPLAVQRFYSNIGLPLVGGKLFTYAVATTTKIDTFKDASGASINTNPIILDFRGEANVWLDPELTYKFVLAGPLDTDPPTNPIWSVDNIAGALTISDLTQQFLGQIIYPRTDAEIAAGVTPVLFIYPPLDARRYGYLADNNPLSAGSNVTALNNAIAVAGATVSGATGATVLLPTGIAYLDTTITLPNRVRIKGQNCSGSLIKATAGFSTPSVPYMFHAHNGIISMFDSILEDLFIDCSDVAGLGGVLSLAWQENSGLQSVGILNFRGIGVCFEQGWGGAATCELRRIQLFASSAFGATAGVRINTIGSTNFTVHILDSVITGDALLPVPRGVDMVVGSVILTNVHFEGCEDGVFCAGSTNATLTRCNGLAGMDSVAHAVAGFGGHLVLIDCVRAGATALVVNDVSGETISAPDPAIYAYPAVKSQSSAVAWCVFDGTVAGTNPPANGYNVASVQRTGAGRYTVNLIRPAASNLMAPVVTSNQNAAGANNYAALVGTSSFTVSLDVAGVATDANEVKVVAFGIG